MMIKAGVYVHIPFCLQKCAYCDFLSHPPKLGEIDNYLEALQLEIKRFKVQGSTLFIGGGTPSVVPPSSLAKLIRVLHQAYGPFSEVTVEVNPGTVDGDYLKILKDQGVNRLSVGVQSFNDHSLQAMGRIHSAKEAHDTIINAAKVGFTNISLDLIYGYPGMDLKEVEKTLQVAVSLPVTHISYYGLQIEPGTPIYGKNLSWVTDDDYVKMYLRGIEILESHRFKQYEVSNFALEGNESKHNLIYWHNEEYLGLGVGAVSRLGHIRYRNVDTVPEYINSLKKSQKIITLEEELTPELLLEEKIMLGLRLREGIGPEKLFGKTLAELYPEVVKELLDLGLLEKEGAHYRITRDAIPIMNTILSKFF